ncbi:hypothetical protein [Candidatus Albibeggiatoa sp. nov. BB20]|uniref:hypothetical protein n=1 Tax=Candidatus Albibeggiatoa sp. nov. BB20 TaxID=3162723 RepID=UPI00336549E9
MKWIQIINKKQKGVTQAVFRERSAKYSQDLTETVVRKKAKTILIVGGADSKQGMSSASREMMKLFNNAGDIWRKQQQPYAYKITKGRLDDKPTEKMLLADVKKNYVAPEPLYYDCGDALAVLRGNPNVMAWYDDLEGEDSYKKLKAVEKDKVLVDYVNETRTVLFLDNVDKLNSHAKIKLVEQMYTRAFRRVMTCKDEKRITPELRLNLNYADENRIQRFMLNSEASSDVTDWLLIMLVGFGATVMVGGGGLALMLIFMLARQGKGKFATRE